MQTAGELSAVARRLYGSAGGLGSRLQTLRPFICPFEELLPLVPQGSRVIDVGCGAGLFLGLLANLGLVSEGLGFDSSESAIRLAGQMRGQLPNPDCVRFLRLDARAQWPDGQFDVLSLIDVLHHVPIASREQVFSNAIDRVRPGGLLLYKDMVEKPRWRAACNTLHDLLLAREWVRYMPIAEVDAYMASRNMRMLVAGRASRFWYGHEWRLYRKMIESGAQQAPGSEGGDSDS